MYKRQGVGKTAIAEGLALRIAAGNVPQRLKNKEIQLLDLTSLVAGTPVSYTHLDVYKRQQLWSAVATVAEQEEHE